MCAVNKGQFSVQPTCIFDCSFPFFKFIIHENPELTDSLALMQRWLCQNPFNHFMPLSLLLSLAFAET